MSADTIFTRENMKKFNVIVGMYHDQVLAPSNRYLVLIQLTLHLVFHLLEFPLIMVQMSL